MYRGKFEFQNRLGQPYSWKEIYRFSLFYFVFEGSVQEQAPPGEGGLVFGEAYTWRGLFLEFYGMTAKKQIQHRYYTENVTILLGDHRPLFKTIFRR